MLCVVEMVFGHKIQRFPLGTENSNEAGQQIK